MNMGFERPSLEPKKEEATDVEKNDFKGIDRIWENAKDEIMASLPDEEKEKAAELFTDEEFKKTATSQWETLIAKTEDAAGEKEEELKKGLKIRIKEELAK